MGRLFVNFHTRPTSIAHRRRRRLTRRRCYNRLVLGCSPSTSPSSSINLELDCEMEGATSSFTFKGSIPEAIVESQRKKRLFLVYVSGENDQNSAQMEQLTWINEKVSESIMRNCVFLHLIEGSINAQNFSSIYPQKGVPCITAVSYNGGTLMWQKGGFVPPDELVAAIEDVSARLHLQDTAAAVLHTALAMKKPEYSGSVSPDAPAFDQRNSSLSSSVADEASQSVIEGSSVTEAVNEESVNLRGELCANSVNALEIEQSGEQPLTIAYAVEDAPVLRTSSAEHSKNLSGEIPIDERSNSKSHDNSLFTNQKNSSSDSPQEGKIGQGICQKSLYEIEQVDQYSESKEVDGSTKVEASTDIHLHIRLPGGSSLQRIFCTTDTLEAVKSYVHENLTRNIGRFDLATPYPRRIFNSEDMSKSLTELGLVKRDSLIVVPHNSAVRSREQRAAPSERPNFNGDADSSTNGGIFGFVKRVLSFANPFSYFGGEARPSNSDISSRVWEYRPNSTIQNPSSGTSVPPGSSPTSHKVGQNWKSAGPGSNIHTLRHDNDDSSFKDRNSFWNGNSTQYGGDDKKNE